VAENLARQTRHSRRTALILAAIAAAMVLSFILRKLALI